MGDGIVLAVRFVNLVCGSIMLGSFVFGLVTVMRAHVRLPPAEAWAFHRFISRRVDWYIPAVTMLTTATAWVLAVHGSFSSTRAVLTLIAALLLTLYGLPFLLLASGLRNELFFVRAEFHEVSADEAIQRMRWWNRWHGYRTALGAAAQVCLISAALSP